MSSTRSRLQGPDPFALVAQRFAPHPLAAYEHDPAGFARECISWPEGDELTGYQGAILDALAVESRVVLRSLHGGGKTTVAALTVLWFALTRDAAGIDWKALCTAGGYRQLSKYLFPEIHKWAQRIRWDVIGRKPFDSRTELLAETLKLKYGQAFAAASDDPALLEGAHASSLLVILDEAKSISAAVFDAIEGAMSGTGESFALCTSTPGEPLGRFYDLCARKPGLTDWRAMHVTLADAITAGRVSPEWAAQRAAQWGSTSAVYLNRVEGEFASSDEDGVIPLAWVEAAIERWQAWAESGSLEETGSRRIIGVDVARSGEDATVLAIRFGPVLCSLERHRRADLMETTGYVVAKLRLGESTAIVDEIGIGSGVIDRLREQHQSALAFNASRRPTQRDRSGELEFLNQRAQAWWRLRELLDPAYESTIALPDDDELIGDLCAPKWRINSRGLIQIEEKDEIRKRLGRSPDAGDAVVMAFSVGGSAPSAQPGRAVPWNYGRGPSEGHGTSGGWLFPADPAWPRSGSIFGSRPWEPSDDDHEAPELPRVHW